MSLKENMDKEIELDPVKWFRSFKNWIISICNKLPDCINPEFKKHKAWPDYMKDNSSQELDDSSEFIEPDEIYSNGKVIINGEERPMTRSEQIVFEKRMKRLDNIGENIDSSMQKMNDDLERTLSRMENNLNRLFEDNFDDIFKTRIRNSFKGKNK